MPKAAGAILGVCIVIIVVVVFTSLGDFINQDCVNTPDGAQPKCLPRSVEPPNPGYLGATRVPATDVPLLEKIFPEPTATSVVCSAHIPNLPWQCLAGTNNGLKATSQEMLDYIDEFCEEGQSAW